MVFNYVFSFSLLNKLSSWPKRLVSVFDIYFMFICILSVNFSIFGSDITNSMFWVWFSHSNTLTPTLFLHLVYAFFSTFPYIDIAYLSHAFAKLVSSLIFQSYYEQQFSNQLAFNYFAKLISRIIFYTY